MTATNPQFNGITDIFLIIFFHLFSIFLHPNPFTIKIWYSIYSVLQPNVLERRAASTLSAPQQQVHLVPSTNKSAETTCIEEETNLQTSQVATQALIKEGCPYISTDEKGKTTLLQSEQRKRLRQLSENYEICRPMKRKRYCTKTNSSLSMMSFISNPTSLIEAEIIKLWRIMSNVASISIQPQLSYYPFYCYEGSSKDSQTMSVHNCETLTGGTLDTVNMGGLKIGQPPYTFFSASDLNEASQIHNLMLIPYATGTSEQVRKFISIIYLFSLNYICYLCHHPTTIIYHTTISIHAFEFSYKYALNSITVTTTDTYPLLPTLLPSHNLLTNAHYCSVIIALLVTRSNILHKMKFLCWNCQGLGSPSTARNLHQFVREVKPDLIFLSETKVGWDYTKSIIADMQFPHYHHIKPIGQAGGLLLLWNNNLNLSISSSNKFIINALLAPISGRGHSNISFFYGSPYHNLKPYSWNFLDVACRTSQYPWAGIGDMNLVLHQDEKSGGVCFDPKTCEFATDIIQDQGLIDLGFIGCPYTWSNKRVLNENIRERLDRCLTTPHWKLLFPQAEIFHLPAISSDHAPILLDLNPNKNFGQSPFKFQNMWIKDPNYQRVVEFGWNNVSTINNGQHSLNSLLKTTKKTLRIWNRRVFGNIFYQIISIKKEIQEIQSLSPTQRNRVKEEALISKLDEILTKEELFWKQKSSDQFVKEGDKNSKYFHILTLVRRNNTNINSIINPRGQWMTQKMEMGIVFVDYFKSILCPVITPLTQNNIESIRHLFPPIFTTEDNLSLTKEIHLEEIKFTMDSIGGLKAPGPDGFPSIFYQNSWDLIKNELFLLVTNFFHKGHDIEDINNTNISLIPKCKNPQYPSDYRPISLCNVSYKVISKTIANRLRPFLSKMISPLQCAFVPQRQITDNTIMTHEIIHSLKRKRGKLGLMAIKLDMSKAFDRIKWDSLNLILSSLGIDPLLCSLINKCFSSLHSSVLINGSPYGYISPTCGLRQGDPLSPCLFILCMEVLSRILQQKSDSNLIHGIKVARLNPPISHLLFADDAFIFCTASTQVAGEILDALNKFCDITGQQINFDKSGILFSKNTEVNTQNEILQVLGVHRLSKKELYLGTPLFLGSTKAKMFQSLITRVESRITGWKSQVLSQAGRTVLINSIITSIPSYQMACFKLPISITDKLNALQRDFWWGKGENKRNPLYLKSWNYICRPKRIGGLGIKRMDYQNKALATRLAWRLVTQPENLCTRILKSKYFNHSSTLQAHCKPNSSWVWKTLSHSISQIEPHICWEPCANSKLNIWSDKWIPSLPLYKLPPTTHHHHDITYVKDLIDHDTNTWNDNLLQVLFPPNIVHQIRKIHLNLNSDVDLPRWMLVKNGRYSVKSMYASINNSTHNTITDEKLNLRLWKSDASPRATLFTWKCLHQIIPTRVTLARIMPIQSKLCPMCNTHEETIHHMLLLCPYTRSTWLISRLKFSLEIVETMTTQEWIKCWFYPPTTWTIDSDLWATNCVTLTWAIWKSRCNKVFQNVLVDPHVVARALNNQVVHTSNGKPLCDVSGARGPTSVLGTIWIPPGSTFVKINVDIKFTSPEHRFGIGYICRNANGEFIAAGCFSGSAASSEQAECAGILAATRWALLNRVRKVVMETDCRSAAEFLKGNAANLDWSSTSILLQVLDLFKSFDSFSIQFCNRSGNVAAHVLAQHTDINILVPVHYSSLPSYLMQQIEKDKLFCNISGY